MKLLRLLSAAVVIGAIVAIIFSQFTTSQYPPCDLVAKGITVSTFGCMNSPTSGYPCETLAPKSPQMATCIQNNYYRLKTFPFGFTQSFGPHSNRIDPKPITENFLASFGLVFVLAVIVLGVVQLKSRPHPEAEEELQ